jgi:hypothetical protein
MAIDLTKLSDEELLALQSGDLTKLSDQTLQQLDTSIAAQEGPSAGQLAAGAGVEVAAGLAGEAAGLALAPFTAGISYPVAKFGSGVAGSIAAQEIEGKPEISYGRALTAGLMNLIPGAAVGKGAKVGTILAKEAKRGALIGAGEATATSMIDEQRAPTFGELTAYAAGGALGGAVVGGALKGGKELVAAAKPSELFPVLGQLSDKIKARYLAPSQIIGREMQDVIIEGKNAAMAAIELGGRVARQVDSVVSKQANPDLARKSLNEYLDGTATTLPTYLSSLKGDIDVFQEKLKELQGKLLSNIDAGYLTASPELRKKVEDSIASGNYLTREYQFFTNSKYKPTALQKQAAVDELAADYLAEAAAAGKTMSLTQAKTRALSYLDELNAKKMSVIKNGDYYPSSIDGFLKERKEVGDALRNYLGEITDPAERMRGTLSRVARGVYRDETDGRIIEILATLGGRLGGVSSKATDVLSAELKLRKFQPQNKLYVNPIMQDAINNIYLSGAADDTSNMLTSGIKSFWNTAVGASKATKVLLNPPSYLVQVYSNVANLAGMGINPFRSSGNALKVALSEFGPIEQLTKNPAARKALLDDIGEATKYGIKGANILDSDIRDSIERGFFAESLQKGLGFFSKAYTVADNAGRYVAWKSNQKMLNKIFPNSDPEAIKKFAASLVNDTYQNYDRLSSFAKTLSRMGVMPQFVSFTLEFARNQYNQGKIIAKMMNGTFGENVPGIRFPTLIRQTPSGMVSFTDTSAMRNEGLKRLAALTSVYAATYATIDAINSDNGVSKEKEAALKETVLGDWEANNKLAVVMNEDGTAGKYMNPSYMVPHAVALSAFEAGLSGSPFESVLSFAADELVGEGSFVGRSVYASLFNEDPRTKKPISYQTDKAKNVSERIAFALTDAFTPGFGREMEKFGKAMRGEGKLSTEDVLKRQVGVRVNDFTVEDGAKMKVRNVVENVKFATADYNAARDYRQLAPNQLEVVYQNANNARIDALNKIGRHVSNMKTLGVNDDKIVTILKDSGLAAKDILGVLTGQIEVLPRQKKITATDIYSEISALPAKEQLSAISEYAKSDMTMYKNLMEKYREESRLKARGVSTFDRLVMSLGIDDGERAAYINRSTQGMTQAEKTIYLNSLRQKKILTSKVENQMNVYR